MPTILTRPNRILILGWLVLICLSFSGTSRAANLVVNVQGSEIDIRADQVPLIDIMKALSEKSGLSLTTGDPLADSVSFHFKEASIEKCLHRLLAKKNYVILFNKTGDDRFTPVGIQVFGGQGQKALSGIIRDSSSSSASPSVVMSSNMPQPADPMKRFTKEWFKQAFGDPKDLTGQISADPVEDGPEDRGIRITRVLSDSVFNKIGIKTGDIINDVNGKPVRTVKDLIDELNNVPDERSMIRIERFNKENSTGPIYLQLQ